MKIVSFSLEQGNKYYGRIDGQRFFIGARVPYKGNKGLQNVTGTPSQKYDRSLHSVDHGFWADFIHPTAMAEGALYHTLNTYDRAHFTFSFLQYAAHVPNGDFVVYLRALLQLPAAKDYFPDLGLIGNRICRIRDDGTTLTLESDTSTAGLMDYLNPSIVEIEDTEVLVAAKFVHWAQTDAAHRELQIRIGIDHFKKNMAAYAKRYGLDGIDDTICLMVADIRHQGRADSATILNALGSANPLQALLKIGQGSYDQRLQTLRAEINRLIADGTFGKRKYNLAKQDFV